METYVILGRYTQQGAAKIKEGPARVEAVRKAMEKVGGKMVAWLSIARIAPCPRVGTGLASTGLATCVIDVD
jgi:hypothetical protein